MNLSLRQLRAFAAVARTASFTRAAAELHLSQPALTVQIRELESALGLKLLDRNTRRVQLTSVGAELLPVFERVLGDLRAVAENARELAAGDRGTVQVAALPSVCARLLPAAIARLRVSHPGITVRLRDTVAQRIVALLRSEDVDIGIGSFPAGERDIETEPLMSDRLVAVMPRGHPFAARRSLRLADLARHPLIVTDIQSSVRALVDRAMAAAGLDPSPAFEVTYMSTAVGLVQAGLGIAILPATALELEMVRGIATSPIRDEGVARPIVVARKTGRSLPPAARTFLQALRAVAMEVGGSAPRVRSPARPPRPARTSSAPARRR